MQGSLIATHAQSAEPGAVITSVGHYTDRVAATAAVRDSLLAHYPDDPRWAAFVLAIWATHRRYFREHARRLERLFVAPPDHEILGQALALCLDHGLAHANDLLNAYTTRGGRLETNAAPVPPPPAGLSGSVVVPVVATRSLNAYQRRFGELCADSGGVE